MDHKRKHDEIGYNFSWEETKDCRIAPGYENEHREGQMYGFIYVRNKKWALVLFDGEEDPDLFKAESIEVSSKKWTNVKNL